MNLISKKDLLAITGISYGQLYRWKRERLIPEEWFIKQSSYTGQETFFPREQILSRVKSILELKDNYSLEDLAKLLSPETSVVQIDRNALMNISEINQQLLNRMNEAFGREQFDFFDVALTVGISQSAEKLGLTGDQAVELLNKSISPALARKNVNVLCTIFHVGGEYHTVFSLSSSPVIFDDEIEVKE